LGNSLSSSLYIQPESETFPHQVAHIEFSAHGESTAGPNQGSVYTHHEGIVSLKVTKPGTLSAMSLCNIHGLWQSSKELGVN
jgi:superoxide reductase